MRPDDRSERAMREAPRRAWARRCQRGRRSSAAGAGCPAAGRERRRRAKPRRSFRSAPRAPTSGVRAGCTARRSPAGRGSMRAPCLCTGAPQCGRGRRGSRADRRSRAGSRRALWRC
eukprot:7385552-Prymnesium_polylepis.2